ncbi:MAG: hypothetical protein COV59_02700 [Candidatus Magasanikbacteria bacterium CG11_big_fil_rev_8_21_14_0_20_39_34]|uniref:Uncharacterized protein n=1 Tax=Candidatus Magasanikbacteria bacterium CG11_big_fil_rev_8_21_14_0_20_39_34 TaxID=1974653 RepID=A0A2H0N5A5_9BACT|nr:MAG: hypothetical protein COV59_02700 [Candidatus Magasanikbacteria bacterium CG11_big_fil_rev_8_21_14_0_20_39_34]
MHERETGLNPSETLKQAKARALRSLEEGNLQGAIDSMVSDLQRDPTRPDFQKNMITGMALALKDDPELNRKKVEEFINGFNM